MVERGVVLKDLLMKMTKFCENIYNKLIKLKYIKSKSDILNDIFWNKIIFNKISLFCRHIYSFVEIFFNANFSEIFLCEI